MFAAGGAVMPSGYQEQPGETLGHVAVNQGLLGILKDVGHSNMNEPEKHTKHLAKLQNHLGSQDHEKAASHMHGHPTAGSASKKDLAPILARIAPRLHNEPIDPEGLRAGIDYLSSAMKGKNELQFHVEQMFKKGKQKLIEADPETREHLKEHLLGLDQNTQAQLDIGGALGTYLPEHHSYLAATAAKAKDYLNSLKPPQPQNAPLDEMPQMDKMKENNWNRQLDVVQNPMLLIQHVKDGTLRPSDVKAIETIYPDLHKSMIEKVTESLVDAKAKDLEIPYRQKVSLSTLLGQPMDSTMTPQAVQAIIQSQKTAGPGPTPQANKKNTTAAELKEVDKVDSLYNLPNESRLEKKKE